MFSIGANSIAIHPDFTRRCPVVDPDDAHLFKSLGCAAENVPLAAAAQGNSSDVAFDKETNDMNPFSRSAEDIKSFLQPAALTTPL